MGWVQLPPMFCTMSKTVCDLANNAMRSHGLAAEPHWLDAIPEALDDCDHSMTPRACKPANAEADLALLSMPCLACDVKGEPSQGPATQELPTDSGPELETDNNKTQQKREEAAPPSNRPMTKPLGNTNVFVDDFIQLGQGGPRRKSCTSRTQPLERWSEGEQANNKLFSLFLSRTNQTRETQQLRKWLVLKPASPSLDAARRQRAGRGPPCHNMAPQAWRRPL